VLGVPPHLEAETASAFRILAGAIPFTIGSQALVGMLVARSRFGQVNLVAAGVSSVSYLGPLAAAALGARLPGIIAVLAAARVGGWLAYLAFCAAEYPQLRAPMGPQRARALALLRFGGWTTVSSLVSPLMTYMDRFVVAALVSTAAVAFYAAPQEVVLRMGMVSGAVVGVLFPAFAAARASPPRLRALLERGLSAVFGMVLPLSLAAGAFAGEALDLWLGAEWAAAARGAVVFLALGLLANGLAKVAAALLQGIGRPDLTARLHMVELPLYLLLLFLLVRQYGLAGAAAAWLARAAVDAAALFWLSCRVLPGAERAARRAAAMGLGGAAALALALLMQPLWLRAGWVLLVGGGVALVFGRGLLRAAPAAPLPAPGGRA
jgi:O-antigen/teichoic acid export membrane protein